MSLYSFILLQMEMVGWLGYGRLHFYMVGVNFFSMCHLRVRIKNFQSEYYEVIARCHKNGGSDEFIMFMLKRLDAVLGEVLSKPVIPYENTTTQVERLMETMVFDVPYTAVQLMEAIGLKSRKSFRGKIICSLR